MRYQALACDYDGTLASDGVVSASTVAALERLVASGRTLLLVTGRQLGDLERTFPRLDLFARIVAENGALLHDPARRVKRALGQAPPDAFVQRLLARGATGVARGEVIVATWTPHEVAAIEAIRELGLELQVIFNKGAVMILPSGINKATGLRAALDELGLPLGRCVGIGDAENDHAFLEACGCSAATANALPALKERVDLVMRGDHGAGVEELIARMLATDLDDVAPRRDRRSA